MLVVRVTYRNKRANERANRARLLSKLGARYGPPSRFITGGTEIFDFCPRTAKERARLVR